MHAGQGERTHFPVAFSTVGRNALPTHDVLHSGRWQRRRTDTLWGEGAGENLGDGAAVQVEETKAVRILVDEILPETCRGIVSFQLLWLERGEAYQFP